MEENEAGSVPEVAELFSRFCVRISVKQTRNSMIVLAAIAGRSTELFLLPSTLSLFGSLFGTFVRSKDISWAPGGGASGKDRSSTSND